MSKKKLLEDIKLRPSRFYRVPGDVLRDRRFGNSERLEILRAWRDEAQDATQAALAGQIDEAIGEVEGRTSALAGHAAE